MLTNSNMPYLDNSLPNPLCLTPPNGILGSEITTLLTVTIPDSTNFDSFSALIRSRVHMLAQDRIENYLQFLLPPPHHQQQ